MNRIDELFSRAKANDQRVFMPFVTAGDPDLATTAAVMQAIDRSVSAKGVPLLFEVGFPYTDPIADGATIQASYTRALAHGVKLADIFATISKLRQQMDTPFVAMASYSLVFRHGVEQFLDHAGQAGFDGAIVPDLPIEEAQKLHDQAEKRDFKIIQLISPTTRDDRAAKLAKFSTGFIYYISVAGITGERDRLPEELPARLTWLRSQTDTPICVGFGISKPDHVASLREVADGVIVGSAIVRQLEDLKAGDEAGVCKIADFAASLIQPLCK